MKTLIVTGLLFIITLSCALHDSKCESIKLKCEYLINPIGIDTPEPRLSWQMKDERMEAKQTAYQIIVGTDSMDVLSGDGDMWVTKKNKTQESTRTYAGKDLNPFTKYFWTIKTWDLNGRSSGINKVASFETGMMQVTNWQGNWISDSNDENLKSAPYFRKVFNITKPIKSARIYIATAGLHELSVNGEKIGDHCLDPMFTRYDRRLLYLTHDVSSQIINGKNAIGILLGNGWYNLQSTAVWYFDKAPWRARPKFCLDLHITFTDGSKEIISTGTDWKTTLSPLIFNSIYTGEHFDSRLIQPGWNLPTFNDSTWNKVIPVGTPTRNITAQILHPIRLVEEIPVKEMVKFDNKNYLFDLGRNISGVSKLKIKGEAGTTIRLVHAERLDKYGKADQSNIIMHYRPQDDSDPFQTDIFILNGNGEETFMPRFNYKGFQYVEVISDKPVGLNKKSLTGFFMHSDVPVAGTIESSNPTLDKIWTAANNSYLSNLFGYPTDCPQREKNGWTGDAHINIETGLYNFDGITIYEKWLADHRDEQQPNGVLPAIIPTSGWGYTWANGPDWTSSIAIIPWNIYLFYGDARLLKQCYENIKSYVDHITNISPNGLTSWGLGDWVPVKSVTNKEFTSSLYYYTDVMILAKSAKIFDNKTDWEKYLLLAEKIKNAINSKYLDKETGIYGNGFQTELSAALYWEIVPDSLKEKVAQNLAERVISYGKHIDVGLLGTKTILNALSENGYADLAYEVALQESYPSWGWWIKNGATTFCENWDLGAARDISLNHIMFGEISAWFYKALGGIFPDPEKPGFSNVILKPNFVPGLDHFKATHEGPFGTIVSSWQQKEKQIYYTIIIPPNSQATLYLKSGITWKSVRGNEMFEHEKNMIQNDNYNVINLESGSYSFIINR